MVTADSTFEGLVAQQRLDAERRRDVANTSMQAKRNQRRVDQANREAQKRADAASAAYNAQMNRTYDSYNSMMSMWMQAMQAELGNAQKANVTHQQNQKTPVGLKGKGLEGFTQGSDQVLRGADQRFSAGMEKPATMQQSRAKLDSPDSYMAQASADAESFLADLTAKDSAHYAEIKGQTQDFLSDLKAMKVEEMGNYRNLSARTIANQASAVAAQQKTTEGQIKSAMMSMGFPPNSAAVQNAVINSRYAAMQTLATAATQIETTYNDNIQSVLTHANDRLANYTLPSLQLGEATYQTGLARQTAAQDRVVNTKLTGASYQQQTAALDRDVWSTMASLSTQFNLSRSQMALAVESARMAGYDNLADYIGNLDTDYVALSPTTTSVINGLLEMLTAQQALAQYAQ
jgi:hypothetical protein